MSTVLMPSTHTPSPTFVGSAADPLVVSRVDALLAVALLDVCTACGGPGAVYGYWVCVPCLGAGS